MLHPFPCPSIPSSPTHTSLPFYLILSFFLCVLDLYFSDPKIYSLCGPIFADFYNWMFRQKSFVLVVQVYSPELISFFRIQMILKNFISIYIKSESDYLKVFTCIITSGYSPRGLLRHLGYWNLIGWFIKLSV